MLLWTDAGLCILCMFTWGMDVKVFPFVRCGDCTHIPPVLYLIVMYDPYFTRRECVGTKGT
jgi:hypothetical protein